MWAKIKTKVIWIAGLLAGIPVLVGFWSSFVLAVNNADSITKLLANSDEILVMLHDFTKKEGGQLSNAETYAANMAILKNLIEQGYVDELIYIVDEYCNIHPNDEGCVE